MAKKDDKNAEPEQPRTFVEENLDDAYALREEKQNLNERIKANRDILRTLRTAGKLDDAQEAELDELYPPRQRAGEDDETNGGEPSGDDNPDNPPAE
jgi:hypothetical protein